VILNILTTATPRIDLHEQTLYPWIKELQDSKIYDKINLYINLDKPKMFTDAEFFTTKNYLFTNFNFVNIIYTECLENTSFSNAAKNVYNSCVTNINHDKPNHFLWLEDDWLIHTRQDAINDVRQFIASKKDVLSFGSLYRITGWPVIFTKKVFDAIYKKLHLQDVDPEVAMMTAVYDIYDMSRENYPRDSLPENVLFRSSFCRCIDLGRDWREVKQIFKTNKWDVNQPTWVIEGAATNE